MNRTARGREIHLLPHFESFSVKEVFGSIHVNGWKNRFCPFIGWEAKPKFWWKQIHIYSHIHRSKTTTSIIVITRRSRTATVAPCVDHMNVFMFWFRNEFAMFQNETFFATKSLSYYWKFIDRLNSLLPNLCLSSWALNAILLGFAVNELKQLNVVSISHVKNWFHEFRKMVFSSAHGCIGFVADGRIKRMRN